MKRMLQAVVLSMAFSGPALAHDDKAKAKPKPEAAKDTKSGKQGDHKTDAHKGKDHDKKH